MEQIRAITVSGVKYNVAQASAVEQQKLMLLIGAKIALHSATGNVEQIDKNLLIGTFLTLPEDIFNQVSNIVLSKAMLAGESTPIDVKSFQGKMMVYFALVAEAVCFNLNDFFTWLDSENDARRAVKVKT
tara:strand:+ start:1688 stop:2077 length:390 start_codon:yes stop_codon:yes gene_type:complete